MASTSSQENQPFISTKLLPRFIQSLFPSWSDAAASLRLFLCILLGGIILTPIFARMPLLGWDWYYFFYGNRPINTIFTPDSPFRPYTKYIIGLLTWMNWRDSLALLGGLTYMAVALGTWKNGGRYGSILLALLTPVPLFMLWVGHPDGLALIGMLTSFIPLALIKPQITIWSFLRNKALIFWLAVFIGAVLLIWPAWPGVAFGFTWKHEAAFGWQALGWPLLIPGFLLLIGAGNDPWRLMAAGCFISPDVMPYHLVVFLPAIGKAQGKMKFVVWFSAWLVTLGVGLGGWFRFINLILPLSIYLAFQTPENYKSTLLSHIRTVRGLYHQIIVR